MSVEVEADKIKDPIIHHRRLIGSLDEIVARSRLELLEAAMEWKPRRKTIRAGDTCLDPIYGKSVLSAFSLG